MKHSKTWKIVKKIAIVDLTIGIAIAIFTWKTLGTEGLAAEFCNLTNVEMCNEVEWTTKR